MAANMWSLESRFFISKQWVKEQLPLSQFLLCPSLYTYFLVFSHEFSIWHSETFIHIRIRFLEYLIIQPILVLYFIMVDQIPDPNAEKQSNSSNSLSSSLDPFDTEDPRWTLKNHLLAYIQRSNESSIPSVTTAHASILWEDLSVTGAGNFATYQATIGGLLRGPFEVVTKLFTTRTTEFRRTILHRVNGIVKDGEMLLVLGRPGSGCTTLLKSLAGLTDDYTGWSGTVEFSGIPIDIIRKKFRGDVIAYNPEGKYTAVWLPQMLIVFLRQWTSISRISMLLKLSTSQLKHEPHIPESLATLVQTTFATFETCSAQPLASATCLIPRLAMTSSVALAEGSENVSVSLRCLQSAQQLDCGITRLEA